MYPKAEPLRLTFDLRRTAPFYVCALAVGAGLAFGQVGGPLPGTYPNPMPGSNPNGTYGSPGGNGTGGTGIPFPRRSKKSSKTDDNAPLTSFAGVVQKADAKSIVLASTDTRYLTFHITDQTKSPQGLQNGDPVRIDATQDDRGNLTASLVKVDRAVLKEMPKGGMPPAALDEPADDDAAAAGKQAENPTTLVTPTGALYDDDDSGPPTLKHGKPPVAKRRAAAPKDDPEDTADIPRPTQVASARPAEMTNERASVSAGKKGQDLIEKAREAAANFLNGLPNYVTQQVTTRYASETHRPNWQPLDVISADLVYEGGKERYQNIKINGKVTKKSPEESGAWSYGEFGTILEDIFHPATAAEFQFVSNTTINRQSAAKYDFQVDRLHSHWKVAVVEQFVRPAYEGTIWIDRNTARVLRIEMQAKEIPTGFPLDSVETAVDYDYVGLGDNKFLLPTHAELLSCERGTNHCQKNVIDWRNYHRYTGESTIEFK